MGSKMEKPSTSYFLTFWEAGKPNPKEMEFKKLF
jgi:hypothetical protein